MVHAFVSESAQLVLSCADKHNGHNADQDIPPERPTGRFSVEIEPNGCADNQNEEYVDTGHVEPVSPVVGLAQDLKAFLQLRVLERPGLRGRVANAGHRQASSAQKAGGLCWPAILLAK